MCSHFNLTLYTHKRPLFNSHSSISMFCVCNIDWVMPNRVCEFAHRHLLNSISCVHNTFVSHFRITHIETHTNKQDVEKGHEFKRYCLLNGNFLRFYCDDYTQFFVWHQTQFDYDSSFQRIFALSSEILINLFKKFSE